MDGIDIQVVIDSEVINIQVETPGASKFIELEDVPQAYDDGKYVKSTASGLIFAEDTDLQLHLSDINNPHSVTKAQVGLGDVPNLKDNLAATAAPTATDDSDSGYSVGSLWTDITNDNVYICIDNTASAAIWRLIPVTQDDLPDGATYKQYDPTNVSITGGSISGITDLAVADGGTGASDAAGAKTNLGFMTDVIDDLTPQLGGDLDTNGKHIGAILQTNSIDNQSKLLQTEDLFADFVVSGLLPATSTTLTSDISAGVAYISGVRVVKAATSHTYIASKDTYVDLDSQGNYHFVEVANGATEPATTADSIRLAKVVTDASAITTVTDMRTLQKEFDATNNLVINNGGVGIGAALTSRDKLTVAGRVSSLHDGYIEELGNFYSGFDEYGQTTLLYGAYNKLAFLTYEGGSVSFDPAPDLGIAENLFDGKGTWVGWNSPSGDIVTEITLPSSWSYMREFGIQWRMSRYPTSFKIEFYNTSDSSWHTFVDETNWDKNYFVKKTSNNFYHTSKIRITARAYESDGYHIAQLFWTDYSLQPMNAYLYRGGGQSVYGGVNLATRSGNIGIGTTDQFGGGEKVIGIANASTVPSSNPTGGGVLYVEDGILKYRNPSGDITSADNINNHLIDTTNPHLVTKAQVGLSNVENILNNYSATAAPTANDDSGSGYSVGSRWIDTTNDDDYVCLDASSGAAVWKKTTP